MTLCKEHLQVKLYGQRGLLRNLLCQHCSFNEEILIFFPFFVLWGDLQGQKMEVKEWGNEWD